MSTERPDLTVASARRHLHGDSSVVVLDGRCAAWLLQHTELRRLRTEVRGFDVDIDAQLMALAIAGLKWAADVNGSKPRKRAEVAPKSEWMDTQEVAHVLGLTSSRVRQELRSGRLNGEQRGRTWRVHRTELEHYRAARAG